MRSARVLHAQLLRAARAPGALLSLTSSTTRCLAIRAYTFNPWGSAYASPMTEEQCHLMSAFSEMFPVRVVTRSLVHDSGAAFSLEPILDPAEHIDGGASRLHSNIWSRSSI